MWEIATKDDIKELTKLFISNLIESPHYISHGEMQMGIAIGPGLLNENAADNWEKYIDDKIERMSNQQTANVLVYKNNGNIDAFFVADVANDGADDFGVICDMYVKKEIRGNGMGKEMINMCKIGRASCRERVLRLL